MIINQNQSLNAIILIFITTAYLFIAGNISAAPYGPESHSSDFFDIDFDTDEPQPSIVPPLTRKDILKYDIYVDFTREILTDYTANIKIDMRALIELDSILFDLYDNTVDSIFIDGLETEFMMHDDFLSIYPLDEVISADDSIRISIFYQGSFPSDAIKHGFDGDGMLVIYSLFWPSLARNFFPSVDHPLDKARSSVSIRTSSMAKVASNGQYLGFEPAFDDTAEVIHLWQNDYPIVTYNICFSICDNYVFIEDSAITEGTVVPIRHLVAMSDAERALVSFGLVPDMINHFDSLYGTYPFDYFGMYVTPFSAGAMEHQSMVMVGDFALAGTIYEHLIAHELSHQWWGDAVSLANWKDFWLNEGMAEYSEYLHTLNFYGPDSALSYHHNVHQQPYKTYGPVEGEFSVYDPDIYLSYTCYRKGACIFHMLHRELGEDFLPMMNAYYENFEYRNVTTDSLIAFIESYSGRDMNWFFDQWVYRDDFFPEFEYWWTINDGNLDFFINQVHDGEYYRVNSEIEIFYEDTSEIIEIEINGELTMASFEGYDFIDSVKLDPNSHILCEKAEVESIDEAKRFIPYKLSAKAYPNPFNSSFNLNIEGFSGEVTVELLDIMGNTIKQQKRNLGRYDIEFANNKSNIFHIKADETMTSGIYFIRVINGDSLSITERILYVK